MTAVRLAILFLLALDPFGGGVVAHAANRSRPARERVVLAAIAADAAALLLVVAALVAEPLLDSLRVSPESAAVAAGTVLAVPAVALLFRGPHVALVRPAGARREALRAALVPLATPVLAGPGPFLVAVAWSARYGAGTTAAGALAASLLAAVVLVAVGRRPPGDQTARWISRGTAAGMVLVAIDLAVDGVLGV